MESGGTRRRYVKHINNAKSTTGRSRLHRPVSSSAAPPPPPPVPVVDNSCLIPDGDVELIISPTGALEPIMPPPASPGTVRRTPLNHIRERVGRLLTKTGQRVRSQSSDRLNVQNFTFADSKIGGMMLAQREQELAAQVSGAVISTASELGSFENLEFDQKFSSLKVNNQLPSSLRQLHSVHCPPGSPHPAHITSQSSPSFSPSITPSTFHSRLKTHLFHRSFHPFPFCLHGS